MPFDARVLKVMIAAPSDISTEKQIVRDVLTEWTYIHSEDKKLVLMPVSWETHSSPAMGERAQEIINKQVLVNCDLLVAVFWTRIGSPTGHAISGTVEEIEEHLAARKPAMLYFSSAPVRPDSVNEEQYSALKQFKEKCRSGGLVESYDSIGEFRDKFSRQLAQTIILNWPNANQQPQNEELPPTLNLPGLSHDAKDLLVEASNDPNGTVVQIHHLGGTMIQTNSKAFAIEGEPRSEAQWEAALKELEGLDLISDRDGKREVFRVTDQGYRVAELIRGGRD